MGVTTRIVLYAEREDAARNAAARAFERIAALEQVMSDYRPDSELSRLAMRPPGEPVALSDDLFGVLARAQRLAVETDGAFDVTVGPLVRQWREARRSGRLPDEGGGEREGTARGHVGWRLVGLDEPARTATLGAEGMSLDLGGIGKGYAAQEAVNLLRREGMTRCLVALAGDIVVGDAPIDAETGRPARGWRIDVRSGLEGAASDGPGGGRLVLVNAAVSTSGSTEQFVEIDGARYAHIMDPRAGLGLTRGCAVTVVAKEGAWADALGTALCVLGPEMDEDALRGLLASHDAAAVMEWTDEGWDGPVRGRAIDPRRMLRWAEPER